MNGFKSNFHSEFACDSDSDVSEAGYLQLRHQQTDPVAAGPWQQSPLPLLASTASCGAPRGVFTNGLFSPDATTTLQAETPQAATCASSSAMEQSAAAQPDSQAAEKLMSVLLDRVEALEQRASSLQVLAVGGHSATSATSPLRVTNGTASSLIEELDRNLSDIQQACHEEPHVDGSAIEARLIEVRRLLHERAEQGGAVAAGDASDAIRLRAELAHLANRLTGEMAEVREFVTSETSDICAFVEERIEEALQQATAQRTQQQQQRRQQEQQQLPGLAGQPSGGRLTIATVQPDNLAMWSPSSAPAAALWSPTSSGRGDVGDAAAMAELPRSVQELWQYMQRGMQRVEGLRGHMEEHLAAVRTLCGFADDRIADINRLHDRFEERIEDLHASHRYVPQAACIWCRCLRCIAPRPAYTGWSYCAI